jgi:hypothetical protein
VASAHQQRIHRIAGNTLQIVAVKSAVVLQMPYHRLNRIAASLGVRACTLPRQIREMTKGKLWHLPAHPAPACPPDGTVLELMSSNIEASVAG